MELLEKLPKDLMRITEEVIQLAEARKCPVYLVGGIVRDLCLGAQNLDLDFVVEGSGVDFAQTFAEGHKAQVKPYYKFQTATVALDGQRIDFAMAREEEYPKPGDYPKVSPSTLKKDLSRRDFTINAMAIGLLGNERGSLIDPLGGYEDLKKKIIRALHPKSFQDDPTRIFRAVRYEQRLAFNLEEETLKWLKEAVKTKALEAVSEQRLSQEREKLLSEPEPRLCLKRLREIGGSAIMNAFEKEKRG